MKKILLTTLALATIATVGALQSFANTATTGCNCGDKCTKECPCGCHKTQEKCSCKEGECKCSDNCSCKVEKKFLFFHKTECNGNCNCDQNCDCKK